MRMNDRYLSHHGVKGQQWGVKHGPPYPIDRDKPLRIVKGTKLNSVSTYKKIDLDKRGIYTYDAADQVDRDIYRGAYGTFLRNYRGQKIYDHEYTVKEDLLLPSHEEKVKAFNDLYKNDTDFQKAFKENYLDRLKSPDDPDYEPEIDYDYEVLDATLRDFVEQNYSISQLNYQRFMSLYNQSPAMKESSEKFTQKLADKGYNAIIDDNNAKLYNGAHSPLYIFEGKAALTETAKPRRIRDYESDRLLRIVNRRNIENARGTFL